MRRVRLLLASIALAAFVFSGATSAFAVNDIPGTEAQIYTDMPVSLNSADPANTHAVFSVFLGKYDKIRVYSEMGTLGFDMFSPDATSVAGSTPLDARSTDDWGDPMAAYQAPASGVYFIDAFARPGMVTDIDEAVWTEWIPFTAMTLNSAATQSVAYGANAGLSVTLRDGDGDPFNLDVPVLVYRSVNGGAWTFLKELPYVDSATKVYVAPTTIRTSYKFVVEDDGYTQPSVSPVKTITPAAYLTNAVAPATMYKGKVASVYGYLKPKHTAGTNVVRIYKWRYESGAWKSYGYVYAKASNYLTYSKYAASMSLPSAGRWRVRAYAPADSGHLATWASAYDYVTVK